MGNPESIANITQINLQDFYEKYYTPPNISILALGGLETSDLLSFIEKNSFSVLKGGARVNLGEPILRFNPITEKRITVKNSEISRVPTEVVRIDTYGVLPGNLDSLAIAIFKRTFYDVAFSELREKLSLTYGFTAKYSNYRQMFEFEIEGTLPSQMENDAEGLVEKCILETKQREDLLEHNRWSMITRFKMQDSSGGEILDNAESEICLYYRIFTNSEDIERLKNFSLEDIKKVGDFLLERKLSLILSPD